MTNMHNLILSESKISKILDRISIEILENNIDEDNIIFVGISGQGAIMAETLRTNFEKQGTSHHLSTATLQIDKSNPQFEDISIDIDTDSIKDAVLIVVDDVLNTGRTQAYSLSYLMQYSPGKVETAILVNRSHTSFPISVTYSGIALSTTIDNHIEVKLESEVGAYLY